MKNSVTKRASIKNLLLFILIITILLIITTISVFASNGTYQTSFGSTKTKVYSFGSDSHQPALSDYPFSKSNNIQSIGFDTLYGSSSSLFQYFGEVPYNKHNEDNFKDYRYYNGTSLAGIERQWDPDDSELPDVSDCNDLHYYALTYSHNAFNLTIGSVLFFLVNIVHSITSTIVKLMITIKSFDITSIITTVDEDGNLAKTLARIFAIDPDTKQISPVLIIGIIAYIFGLVLLSFKFIKGNNVTLKKLFEEIGFLIMAACIAAIYFSTNGALNYSKAGTKILNSLSDFVTGGSSSTSIYTYDTGNANLDSSATEKALIDKIYIDQIIKSETGYPISKLFIQDDGGNSDFASNQATKEALDLTFGSENGGLDAMAISTSINDTAKINNLGYYLWASGTNVVISKDGNINTRPFYKGNSSTYSIRTSNNSRCLFVIDFLNNLAYGNTENIINDSERAKVKTIFNNLCNPNYLAAFSSIFLVCLQNLSLAFALFSIEIFALIGQIIVTFGSYGMVVMPALLLVPQTRKTAKQFSWSYAFGFLRYLVGSALFATVITISVLLCELNDIGIIVSAIICFLLGKFAPQLLKELNSIMIDAERGHGLSGMSKVNRLFANNIDRQSRKKKEIKNRKRFDSNGNLKERGDLYTRTKNAIQGFKSKNDINDEDLTVDNAEMTFTKGYSEETKTTNTNTETTIENASNNNYNETEEKTNQEIEKTDENNNTEKVTTNTTVTETTKTNNVESQSEIKNISLSAQSLSNKSTLNAKKDLRKQAIKQNINIAAASRVNLKLGKKLEEKYAQKGKDKEELKQRIISEASQKINSLNSGENYKFNLNDEINNAKYQILNETSKNSRINKNKVLTEVANTFTKKDVYDIQKEIAKNTSIKSLNIKGKYGNSNNSSSNSNANVNNKNLQ